MKTRSQAYSQKVFEQISLLDLSDDKKKSYGTICHNFPLMVLKSGLSQAVAFIWVKSKGKADGPHGKFLSHLAELVGSQHTANPAEFQKEINKLDLINYQRQTRKTLAASIWYKRFAESMLNVKPGEDNDA